MHPSEETKYLPIPLSTLAGQDLAQLEAKAAAAEALKKEQEVLQATKNDQDTAGDGETETEKIRETTVDAEAKLEDIAKPANDEKPTVDTADVQLEIGRHDETKPAVGDADISDDGSGSEDDSDSSDENYEENHEDKGKEKSGNRVSGSIVGDVNENVVVLGLRVYTSREAPAEVNGQLKHEMATSFAGFMIDDQS